MKKKLIIVTLVILTVAVITITNRNQLLKNPFRNKTNDPESSSIKLETNPLQIIEMRKRTYPGGEIKIEEELEDGINYKRYLASYKSDGLKINGLLTIPSGEKPKNGWPAIIFNHGYIPPKEYKTLERYILYVDGFARNGYIVYKIDYRGHDQSEGNPSSGHLSPDYTVDVLNAVSSMKKFSQADPAKIGLWGHSLGGGLTLRAMVISKDIKAAVIWAGMVNDSPGLIRFRSRLPWFSRDSTQSSMLNQIILKYGTPSANIPFWKEISPYTYLGDVSGPIQLHHGIADESVPWEFSENLKKAMEKVGKKVEYYTYEGGDHNISSPNFEIAMERSINFFNKYLKSL